MIILDTNVLSALMRETPEPEVIAWLDKQPRTSIWITSITYLEVSLGIEVLPKGRRQTNIRKAFNELIHDLLEQRIAVFDTAAAEETALIMAKRRQSGVSIDLRDSMIGGIASVHRATLATRNTRHFAGLTIAVINPWSAQK